MVDIKLEQAFEQPLPLDKLRGVKPLAKMELLRQGSRLSVQPVTESEWMTVLALAKSAAAFDRSATAGGSRSSGKAAKHAKKKAID
jgi:hypothetical protein